MKKAFTKRLVLTFRNFATFRYSQEQGNSRCPAWYVFTSYQSSRLSDMKHIGVNISGVGSLRCSFYYTGQCEGLEAWTGEQ